MQQCHYCRNRMYARITKGQAIQGRTSISFIKKSWYAHGVQDNDELISIINITII